MEFDPDLIIPDKNKCIAEGAVALYRNYVDGYRVHHLSAVADRYGFSVLTPIRDLTDRQYNALVVRLRRGPPVLGEGEEQRCILVAYREVGGACAPGRTAPQPDPLGVPPPRP